MRFAEKYKHAHDDPYVEVGFDQFKIMGRSIAGVETVLTIPQWNLSFDTGRAPDFAYPQDYLALSHWHLDHAGGLPIYVGLRHLNGLSPVHLIVPEEKLEVTDEVLKNLKKASGTQFEYELLSAKKPIHLKNKLTIKTIPSFHAVPSTGYLIEQTKHQLKPEFKNKPEKEIIQAKEKGIEVDQVVTEALLAFSGDTKWEFLETGAARAKYLLMECSFFGDQSDYEKIRNYGHTHIVDWKEHAELIQSECVIMIHTSQRYRKKEIEEACQKNLPKDLVDRLIVFR